MRATLPLLARTDFPPLTRRAVETVQVNLGYVCNQACLHCHVNASPDRTETMTAQTAAALLAFIEASGARTVDLTGGAPELCASFRPIVTWARERGLRVIDRCNLTILSEPGQEGLADFLATHAVEVVASLPCYTEELVDRQRGEGAYRRSIDGIRRLNALGYGQPGTGLVLNLVYNPQGPSLPPPQPALEADYRRVLGEAFGIAFTGLFTLANMPIQRFGSTLLTRGQFNDYMALLRGAHRAENLESVMCRSLVSVDWQGYLYDCDFNQMLGLPLQHGERPRTHITNVLGRDLAGKPIVVRDHCYGCTAGQGSSCGGALA